MTLRPQTPICGTCGRSGHWACSRQREAVVKEETLRAKSGRKGGLSRNAEDEFGAVAHVACPRCGRLPGVPCGVFSPTLATTEGKCRPHRERLEAYRARVLPKRDNRARVNARPPTNDLRAILSVSATREFLMGLPGEDRLTLLREATDGMCITFLGCGEDHGEDCTCKEE